MSQQQAASQEDMDIQLEVHHLLTEFLEPVLIVHRTTLVIRAANERCEELTGYRVQELQGESVELLAPDDAQRPTRDRGPRLSWAALLEQPGLHEEVQLQRKDGSCLLAEVNVARANNGEEPMALLFVRDLTERRKLERELITKHLALREAYEELAHSNRELERANAEIKAAQRWLVNLEKMATIGRFAAGVAHEVNNPMAFILQNLTHLEQASAHIIPVLEDQLQHETDAANRARMEEIIGDLGSLIHETLEGSTRVGEIMRQLHSFSNVSDQEAEWTDLRELIDSSLMMVDNQIRYRARLERHYYDIPNVLCVPNNIGQVLVNLLVNAIQSLQEGDPQRNLILVRTRQIDNRVAVEIQDTGCGIPPENMGRILEPFFTTKPRGKGTGLGLAISASVVEQHSGELQFESEPGRGTLVRMILPEQGALRPPEPGVKQQADAPPGKLRILLVDDEVYFLRAMRRTLGKKHEVVTASSGHEALDLLIHDDRFDLVMSDLMMPDMDGMHLYRRLEATHPHLLQRLVFMSGGVFDEDVRSFIKENGLDVLSKPFRSDEFDAVVARFSGRQD